MISEIEIGEEGITKRHLEDMVYMTRGLPQVIRQSSRDYAARDAHLLERAWRVALWTPERAKDLPGLYAAQEPSQKKKERAFKIMCILQREYKHFSQQRKHLGFEE